MPLRRSLNGRHQGEPSSSSVANGSVHVKVRAKSRKGPGRITGETGEVTEGQNDMGTMLAQKQAQLEAVVDKHDTLVREKFHMEQFTMMLQYDPKEAKRDASKVFANYKAAYDLVDKAIPSPSRPTRSRRTEQIQLLKTSSISAPSVLSAQKRSESKTKTASRIKGQPVSAIKDKQTKTAAQHKETGSILPSPTAEPGVFTHQESVSVMLAGKTNRSLPDDTGALPAAKKRRMDEYPNSRANGHIEKSCIGRRSDRLRGPVGGPTMPQIERETYVDRETDTLLRTPTVSSQRAAEESEVPCISASPVVPKFKVKRIRLLVRRPPPNLTNPNQRAPDPKHNSSLTSFLNSYVTLDDTDVRENFLRQKAAADAVIFERAEAFRRQGGFIPDPDVLLDLKNSEKSLDPSHQRTQQDYWDVVIESAIQLRKSWIRRPSGEQIAGQIANKIRTYWEGLEARKEKLRQQEERNLRALAKTTIRAVTNEWKKAVLHIREKERLRLEAEEVRRGHEHLDALLDQSGQLLETQQMDLSRGDITRSRSSSISHTFRGWESEGEEEDEADEGDPDEEGEGEDDVEEGAAPERVDGENKVNDEDVTFREGHSSEGGLSTSENDDDDDDDEHDTRMLLAQDEMQDVAVDDNRPDYNMETDGSSTLAQHDQVDVEFFPLSPQLPLAAIPEEKGTSPPTKIVQVISSPPAIITPRIPSSQEETLSSTLPPSPPPTSPSNATRRDLNHVPHSLRQPPSPSPVSDSRPDQSRNSHAGGSSELFDDFGTQVNGLVGDEQPVAAQTIGQEPEEDETLVRLVTIEDMSVGQDQAPAETEDGIDELPSIPVYLKPFAVAPVVWDPNAKVVAPLLLRGVLRPYQQSGLEWLASLHVNNLNGILADEMGLGKTIQTIALLAHLACDRGIWGPHLIIVPTSVLLNWEMEFKKFLPGFKILSYHGNTKRRKELRQGWNDKHHFNVCITSYSLASRDAHIFKRKAWYYMILDEAHMIKNFKSQRWNILLMFRSFRRLLLTGTPLQNNLTELWALLQFLMSGANFANLKEFGDWFSNPLEKAIEMGNILDDETMQRVSKLHIVLRPYLLRRLKRDVEKELPSKFEHLVICPLSKRQRFLYDEFMSRAQTRDALQSGVYQKIANILMQLRKVCNHPDLFEVRPIVTSFAMERSVIADFEIQELLVRRRWMKDEEERINLGIFGFQFINAQDTSMVAASETSRLEATALLSSIAEIPGEPPPKDMRTIAGFRKYSAYFQRARTVARWSHMAYLNRLRCSVAPIYSSELLNLSSRLYQPILPIRTLEKRCPSWEASRVVNSMVRSYEERADGMASLIDRFAFVTPAVVALDMPRLALPRCEGALMSQSVVFDKVLHAASVKLQIAFPDPSLLQYDCGKLQELTRLLREKKAGGHRILIFTQMTRILDILEIFLNLHGYLYLRLDGATKIEDRQYITERFNADARIFCFIASSRSGGVGINLTGADTVVFYDSDFNPQMDKQCEDRAHRIGQIRDVHIYRFVSQYTVEEALLQKANQKRSLDDLVIQKGEFDWRSLFNDQGALSKALEEFEDTEDAHAAAVAAREEVVMEGADEADFGGDVGENPGQLVDQEVSRPIATAIDVLEAESDSEEGGSIADYMILFVQRDYDYFREWRI